MSNRMAILAKIAVSDIFRAKDAAGPVRICLTIRVTETTILARAVTTQDLIEFDRRTGTSEHKAWGEIYNYVIDSVARLPEDIHEIMLSLDRKYRDSEYKFAENPDWEPTPEESRLTKEQIRGLLFVADFYPAHPLPRD